MILVDMNIGGGYIDGLAHLLADAGNVLSRDVQKYVVGVGPLSDAAVSFEAAVGNHRRSVVALMRDLRLLKCRGGIPRSFFQRDFVPFALFRFSEVRLLVVEYEMR